MQRWPAATHTHPAPCCCCLSSVAHCSAKAKPKGATRKLFSVKLLLEQNQPQLPSPPRPSRPLALRCEFYWKKYEATKTKYKLNFRLKSSFPLLPAPLCCCCSFCCSRCRQLLFNGRSACVCVCMCVCACAYPCACGWMVNTLLPHKRRCCVAAPIVVAVVYRSCCRCHAQVSDKVL